MALFVVVELVVSYLHHVSLMGILAVDLEWESSVLLWEDQTSFLSHQEQNL